MRHLVLLSVALATAFIVGSTGAMAGPSKRQLAEIDARITEIMARDDIPGLSVGIAMPDGQVWSKGYGFSDLENDVPMTDKSMVRIGGVSQILTATAAHRLASAGKLNLEAPLQDYCPAYPEKKWPITTRQLLGHMGGVRHRHPSRILDPDKQEAYSIKHFPTVAASVAWYARDPLLHEPGKVRFSIPGYALVSCAIEGASDSAFPVAMDALLFERLGMTATQLDNPYTLIKHRARGYCANAWPETSDPTRDDEPVESSYLCAPPGYEPKTNRGLRSPAGSDVTRESGGGAFISSAHDLARFMRGYLDGTALPEAQRAIMTTNQVQRTGEPSPFGLGITVSEQDEATIWFAAGTEVGASAFVMMFPKDGLGVVVLSNLEDQPSRRETVMQIVDAVRK